MITQEYLKQCLSYDPETGVFIWNVRPRSHFKTDSAWRSFNSQFAGSVAGTRFRAPGRQADYIRIRVKGKDRYAHRLSWLYVHGVWPSDQIDHKDQVGTNNSISNLREVSNIENGCNQPISKRNRSGVVGVSWSKGAERWQAIISIKGKRKHLGYFDHLDDASQARVSAEQECGYHENHGKRSNITKG